MKKVLYISYDGMTDPLGQSQVLPYICGLAKLGYSFTLISCEKPHRFEANRHIIEKIAEEHGIDWQPLPYTKNPPVLSTVNDLRRIKRKAVDLHRHKNFSMVHCRGHVPALVGLHLKRKYGVKFLFDMRGFWADEKVDAGAWNQKNPLYRAIYQFFKKKEKAFIEESDHMICLTHKGVEEMLRWKQVQVKPESITVIPCCADDTLFNPDFVHTAEKEKIRQELRIKEGDVILSYLGSIGTWYMLDEMLDYFICFKKAVPCARFLFITHDEHDRIMETAARKGINKEDIILRPAKRSEVPVVLSLSRYSVFFIRPTYSKISSSPTKQGEIMAMGIPVVCNAGVGDTDLIVDKYKSGVLVSQPDTLECERSVETLLQSRFDPAAIRSGALDYFSLEKGLKNYEKVYGRIFSKKGVNIHISNNY